ncbi:hypothetical protein [Clostridium sp.]|uniref:hypothetical protein n=1 Tax=Clostridium sp. TaxID=1506 RepID=UPI003061690E
MRQQQKREIVDVARKNIRMVDTIKVKELLSELNYEDNEELETIYSEWIEEELSELLMYSEETIIELKDVEDAKDFLSNINHLCEEIKSPNVEDIRAVIDNLPQYLYDLIETFANSSTSNTSKKYKAMNVLNYYKEHPTITNEVDKTLIRYI